MANWHVIVIFYLSALMWMLWVDVEFFSALAYSAMHTMIFIIAGEVAGRILDPILRKFFK